MKPAPALRDGRYVLEPFASDHVNELIAAVRESLPELTAWLPWAHAGYDAKDATEWLRFCAHAAAEGLERHYAVRDAEHRFVGSVGLRIQDPRNRMGTLGYWTRTGAARRGVATAATRVLARHAFADLGLRRIEILVAPANLASRRVAERAGAREEGIARARLLRGETSEDAVLYSLLPTDLAPY